jgi:hypothetical protein
MSHDEVEKEAFRLFDMLDLSIRKTLTNEWKKYGNGHPTILTNPEHVDAASEMLGFTVDKAATNGVNMYFRIDKIEAAGDDPRLVILHELAHCYFFATGRFSLDKYRKDEKHRKRCELETIRLSEMWFHRIQNLDKKSRSIEYAA